MAALGRAARVVCGCAAPRTDTGMRTVAPTGKLVNRWISAAAAAAAVALAAPAYLKNNTVTNIEIGDSQ